MFAVRAEHVESSAISGAGAQDFASCGTSGQNVTQDFAMSGPPAQDFANFGRTKNFAISGAPAQNFVSFGTSGHDFARFEAYNIRKVSERPRTILRGLGRRHRFSRVSEHPGRIWRFARF